MEISQIINEIYNNKECQICLKRFIKLTNEQYNKFIKENDKLLPYDFFDDGNYRRCYEDRFECLTCKNVICRACYWNFKNHKFKPDDDYIEDYEYFGELDEDEFAEGCPGEDCPIICPFCRIKDYKIFYGNQMPYELLNEIRKA